MFYLILLRVVKTKLITWNEELTAFVSRRLRCNTFNSIAVRIAKDEISQYVNRIFVCLSILLPFDKIARFTILIAIVGFCNGGRRTAYSGIYGNIKLKFIIYYSFSISLPTSFIFHLYILTNTILCQRNIDSEIIRLFATTDIFQAKPIHVFIIDTSDLG